MDVMDIESVYNKYFKDVFKFILGLCGNYALAEEITQETFFKAFKNINACDAYEIICIDHGKMRILDSCEGMTGASDIPVISEIHRRFLHDPLQ